MIKQIDKAHISECEINNLCVLPDYRHYHIGKKLLEHAFEKVTEESNTPDLDAWTMHIVEIAEDKIESIVPLLSKSIDGSRKNGGWYTDLKSDDWHYIIFSGKAFKVDRSSSEQYEQAKEYGMSIGIPEYLLPNKSWAKSN